MTTGDCVLSGRALVGDDLEIRDVAIEIRAGIIHRVEETDPCPGTWICPALFNAHTHLGDSVAMDTRAEGGLEALVTPPHGLKHRILARTPRDELVRAMQATLTFMEAAGTAGCADFREGGEDGVRALQQAASGLQCRPLIFGREGGEVLADGAGISSVRDVQDIEQIITRTRGTGGRIAIHAGERDRFDVDRALCYEPDLLVHCTHATRRQLIRCADEEIPIAVCARSNWMLGVTSTGKRPPISDMLDLGCEVLLGTDNCMVVQPDLWQEMAFVATVYGIAPLQVFRAAAAGSRIAGRPYSITEGNPANLIVIDPRASNLWLSHDLARTLVTRTSPLNIVTKVINS